MLRFDHLAHIDNAKFCQKALVFASMFESSEREFDHMAVPSKCSEPFFDSLSLSVCSRHLLTLLTKLLDSLVLISDATKSKALLSLVHGETKFE